MQTASFFFRGLVFKIFLKSSSMCEWFVKNFLSINNKWLKLFGISIGLRNRQAVFTPIQILWIEKTLRFSMLGNHFHSTNKAHTVQPWICLTMPLCSIWPHISSLFFLWIRLKSECGLWFYTINIKNCHIQNWVVSTRTLATGHYN